MRQSMHVNAPRTAPRSRPGRRAFTLMEMLLVIAIIGLLAALVVPQLAKSRQETKINTTKAQLSLLTTAVNQFYNDCNRYPTEAEGLAALVTKPQGLDQWNGPYLEKKVVPKDGFGRDFVYKLDKEYGFEIKSLGADGKEGGEPKSADADISNRT